MLSKHAKFVAIAVIKIAVVLFPIAGVIDAIVDAFEHVYGKEKR